MKASELRVTNLVLNDRIVNAVIFIGIDSVQLITPQGNNITVRLDLINPIPLTEEWLLRFGGKLDDLESDCYILSSLTVDYRLNKTILLDGSFYWVCDKVLGDTCFIYVHQLQNLYFALTGTELTLQP